MKEIKKKIVFSEEKNKLLKEKRNVSFEAITLLLKNGNYLSREFNFNRKKQEFFVCSINDYIHYVPFVEKEEEIFLKTIIPSRKLNKKYKEKKYGKKI